jgi:hypothetical protein
VFDVYDNDKVVAYPLVILNVVVVSTTQGEPLPADMMEVVIWLFPVAIVVVVIEPLPLLETQLGNGLHVPLALHVTFKLPPILT